MLQNPMTQSLPLVAQFHDTKPYKYIEVWTIWIYLHVVSNILVFNLHENLKRRLTYQPENSYQYPEQPRSSLLSRLYEEITLLYSDSIPPNGQSIDPPDIKVYLPTTYHNDIYPI